MDVNSAVKKREIIELIYQKGILEFNSRLVVLNARSKSIRFA